MKPFDNQNDMVYRPLEMQLIAVEKKVYDVLLKNNCDLMDRVKTLEAENKVLDSCIEHIGQFLDGLQPKNMKTKICYQSFLIDRLKEVIIGSATMTDEELYEFEKSASKQWKETQKTKANHLG